MAAGEWRFDESLWPVLIIEAPPQLTRDGWKAVFRELERTYLPRPGPGKKVFITTEGGAPSLLLAGSTVPWWLRNRHLLRRELHGWALVLPTPHVRAAVEYMVWWVSPSIDVVYFGTRAEAIKWAFSKL